MPTDHREGWRLLAAPEPLEGTQTFTARTKVGKGNGDRAMGTPSAGPEGLGWQGDHGAGISKARGPRREGDQGAGLFEARGKSSLHSGAESPQGWVDMLSEVGTESVTPQAASPASLIRSRRG